ncbi:MAG: hypothetical protein GXZ14_00795 [Ruminococcaceae bacterium]|nr:hypothetical protein [Oscillospiraceae bacterium]
MIELEVIDNCAECGLEVGGVIVAREKQDYNKLENIPTLNGREFAGDFVLAADDVGAMPTSRKITNQEIKQIMEGF